MVVVIERPKMVNFGELNYGSVFKNGSDYCIKIHSNNYMEHNFVYLNDGELGHLNDNDRVEKIDHQLSVHNQV